MKETCPNCGDKIEIGNYHIRTGQGYSPEIYYAICDGPEECCNFFIAAEEREFVIDRLHGHDLRARSGSAQAGEQEG